MQVKSIAECSKWTTTSTTDISLTFIKLPLVVKLFVLSIFERPLLGVVDVQ